MDQDQLLTKEKKITGGYKAFLAKVREAFNTHCDEIKEETTQKLRAVPEDDVEGRKKILQEQKAQLDRTLAELRQLLAQKGAEVRTQLEEIANLRDQESFDLDEELAEVESLEAKAA
jgi:molybdopterin converting factor small subunit